MTVSPSTRLFFFPFFRSTSKIPCDECITIRNSPRVSKAIPRGRPHGRYLSSPAVSTKNRSQPKSDGHGIDKLTTRLSEARQGFNGLVSDSDNLIRSQTGVNCIVTNLQVFRSVEFALEQPLRVIELRIHRQGSLHRLRRHDTTKMPIISLFLSAARQASNSHGSSD